MQPIRSERSDHRYLLAAKPLGISPQLEFVLLESRSNKDNRFLQDTRNKEYFSVSKPSEN